ncbi:MAG TPA: caspase family protein [Pyrinomonadaceae bacterium]
MPKGLSIHVGVNEPDSSFQMPKLKGCVNDANTMRQIAEKRGFQPQAVLENAAAGFHAVRDAVTKAADDLDAGDIFLFTFSGHGSTQPTLATDEPDRQDETILLFDCVLIDNYLRRVLWSKFKPSVRILGVSDCCHAGTVLFSINFTNFVDSVTSAFRSVSRGIIAAFAPNNFSRADETASIRTREFNRVQRDKIIALKPNIHDEIRNEILTQGADLQGTLLTLAACRDDEKALDGDDNGAFTKALDAVLRGINPPKNYNELMTQITNNLAVNGINTQHPILFSKANTDTDAFLGEVPFTI